MLPIWQLVDGSTMFGPHDHQSCPSLIYFDDIRCIILWLHRCLFISHTLSVYCREIASPFKQAFSPRSSSSLMDLAPPNLSMCFWSSILSCVFPFAHKFILFQLHTGRHINVSNKNRAWVQPCVLPVLAWFSLGTLASSHIPPKMHARSTEDSKLFLVWTWMVVVCPAFDWQLVQGVPFAGQAPAHLQT